MIPVDETQSTYKSLLIRSRPVLPKTDFRYALERSVLDTAVRSSIARQ